MLPFGVVFHLQIRTLLNVVLECKKMHIYQFTSKLEVRNSAQ